MLSFDFLYLINNKVLKILKVHIYLIRQYIIIIIIRVRKRDQKYLHYYHFYTS